jgi:ureidoacrylate peracid hydrolase
MPLPIEVEEVIDIRRSVLIAVDMNHRHLDFEGVGTLVLPRDRAEQVLARGAEALAVARPANMPVIHIATPMVDSTAWGPRHGRNPFLSWQTGKPIPGAGFVRHGHSGELGRKAGEIMPAVAPLPHEPVVNKMRYSGFFMTDLELILRSFGVETVFIMGVNTNNCCLHTFFDAQARDYRVILLEDACGSMNGQAYHEAAVKQIEAALGWVISVADFASVVGQRAETVTA